MTVDPRLEEANIVVWKISFESIFHKESVLENKPSEWNLLNNGIRKKWEMIRP